MKTRQLNGTVTPCIKVQRPLPFTMISQVQAHNDLLLPEERTLLWGPVKLVQG
jgi:hypothetical protein